MTELTEAKAIRLLTRAGYDVQPPRAPIPVNHCAVCGIDEPTHEENAGWPLVPVMVIVNRGEEGASYVTRWYCEDHMDDLTQELLRFGLGSHHHGSTTMVEADPEVCGGYGKCTLYARSDDMEEVYRDGPLHAGPA